MKPTIGRLWMDALDACLLGQIHLCSVLLERTYAV